MADFLKRAMECNRQGLLYSELLKVTQDEEMKKKCREEIQRLDKEESISWELYRASQ